MNLPGDNYELGNRAMASILLLYYHLISEEGFTNDQTIYSESIDVDLSSLLNAYTVEEDSSEINVQLIREGATISLICDLNDCLANYEKDYVLQPQYKQIKSLLDKRYLNIIPEVDLLLELIQGGINSFDFQDYKNILELIYQKYVMNYFRNLTSNETQ